LENKTLKAELVRMNNKYKAKVV
jgi:microtubule-associated protein-like 6